ncbi:hypothetical protein RCL1_001961 [Eukaryota sp. TZLM3-RCL]
MVSRNVPLSVHSPSPLAASFARSQLRLQNITAEPSSPTSPQLNPIDSPPVSPETGRKRRAQHVVPLSLKKKVLVEMNKRFEDAFNPLKNIIMDEELPDHEREEKLLEAERKAKRGLIVGIIGDFRECFGASENANIKKAAEWFKSRESLLQQLDSDEVKNTVSNRQGTVRRVVHLKALSGRRPKRAEWVQWLYGELVEEFTRLKKAGVMFSPSMLIGLAQQILEQPDAAFNGNFVPENDNNEKKIADRISSRWIQQFMETNNIVVRCQKGKLQTSAEKKVFIERQVAYHLGQMKDQFQQETIEEGMICNFDETHFVFNMDNGKTLGFTGDTEVRYADVVAGGEGLTMIVKITGGANAKVDVPMLVFMNKNSSYLIRGTPDVVEGATYRSAPKGFVNSFVFAEYFKEGRVWKKDRHNRKIIHVS